MSAICANQSRAGLYVNSCDCGGCMYFSGETCDYYLMTGKHRNEDAPVRQCNVRTRKSRSRRQDIVFRKKAAKVQPVIPDAKIVTRMAEVPENAYCSTEIAAAIGYYQKSVANRLLKLNLYPDYRLGPRSYYSLQKTRKVVATFRDRVTDPQLLPQRLRIMRERCSLKNYPSKGETAV